MKLTNKALRKIILESLRIQNDWKLILNDWMQNWHQNKDIGKLFNDEFNKASPSQKKALLKFRDAMQNMTAALNELAGDHDHESLSGYDYTHKDDIDYSGFNPSYDDDEPDF